MTDRKMETTRCAPAAGCDPVGTIGRPVPRKLLVMALSPSSHTMPGSFLP